MTVTLLGIGLNFSEAAGFFLPSLSSQRHQGQHRQQTETNGPNGASIDGINASKISKSRVPLPFLVALAVCPQHLPFAIWSFRLAWCLGSLLSREGKDRSQDLILLLAKEGIIVDSTPSNKSNSLVAREPKPPLSGWSVASSPASKRTLRLVWCGFCFVVWNELNSSTSCVCVDWWKRYELNCNGAIDEEETY